MTPPKTKTAKGKQRRNVNRKLLRKVRNEALTRGESEPDIQPDDALQYVLDRAVHMLKNAIKGVESLKADEVWRDTQMGRIPNEWIRLEEDLRKEVSDHAGRMIALDIEGRCANAAEALSMVLAPVLDHILSDLGLTKAQKARTPAVVHNGPPLRRFVESVLDYLYWGPASLEDLMARFRLRKRLAKKASKKKAREATAVVEAEADEQSAGGA
jgi:hypothetical protein